MTASKRGARLSLALVLALATALTPVASATAAPAESSPLDPAAVGASVRYLVSTYGVTEQEALRRLRLQRDAAALDAQLRQEAAGQYGGMWLDQDNGGVLVVATTSGDTTIAPRLDRMADRAHITTRPVQHSLAELTATRDQIAGRVAAGPDGIYLPEVSETENRVVVWERSWLASTRTAVASIADDTTRSVATIRPLAEPKPLADNESATTAAVSAGVDVGFCHPLYCTGHGPMRGGLRLDMKRDDGTWGGCTSGFNLRSTGGGFPGQAWVLTAGHCMKTKTNNTPTQHNGVDVLKQHGIEKAAYPYDYAALPYVDSSAAETWLGQRDKHNLVLTYCPKGAAEPTCGGKQSSVDQSITGVSALADVKAGWVVCASGSGSSAAYYPDSVDSGAGDGYQLGVHCGQVLSTDVGINTNVCARAGDSGGPLFSQVNQTALGILNGGQQSRTGPCAPGELNNYAPIDTVLTDLSERVASQGSTFAVITTPNG
ncbi:S1 family peptidase [Goodfellowiella coeruleoviolacea]|uniref:Streptogrisin C n=1 Tax=Goodfellowiella coeruleoviolacea TaxID=334858 RepID=A0AAE3GC65_9PSEU|nr:S1 family peptidase [Goodfellowiella coeruleoviolacea]MCP2165596.1 streptogrisin C [Goodfellowiella coeruleoviolacea]